MSQYSNSNEGSVARNSKVMVLAAVILITFVVYGLKLFSLQVIGGAQYRRQSRTISSQIRTIPAQRGEIFDRNANINMPMVVDTESFAVDITPAEIPDGHYDSVASRLAGFL